MKIPKHQSLLGPDLFRGFHRPPFFLIEPAKGLNQRPCGRGPGPSTEGLNERTLPAARPQQTRSSSPGATTHSPHRHSGSVFVIMFVVSFIPYFV